MTDTITLPRELVERARKALKPLDYYMTVYDRYEIADNLRARLAAPSEDIEALRLNDARYRWIRDNHEIKGRAMEIVYNSNGKEWDAAIDWAMQEDKT